MTIAPAPDRRGPINHLVILRPPYLDLILSGDKTVESRLSRRRHPAATRCLPGDVLYLKRTGGDIEVRATVAQIDVFADLDLAALRHLTEQWSRQVAATTPDDWYQRIKHDARHALFLTLRRVERFHIPRQSLPRRLPWASAWIAGQPVPDLVRHFEPPQCEESTDADDR
ncbi:MAG: ASCH domain-containing protein [Dehalococcoidia bacterium]